jgi:hypothetical protein
MEALRGIKCASFWDALVLRLMLEEHGVRVHVPDQGVVLSMVAAGELEGIRAAVAQLSHKFPHSGSVMIEGEDRERSAESRQATALPSYGVEEAHAAHPARPRDLARRPGEADTGEFAAITGQLAGEAPVGEPTPSQADPGWCSASTAKGRRCKLPARPGSATCSLHARHALPAAGRVRPVRRPGLPRGVLSSGSRALRLT